MGYEMSFHILVTLWPRLVIKLRLQAPIISLNNCNLQTFFLYVLLRRVFHVTSVLCSDWDHVSNLLSCILCSSIVSNAIVFWIFHMPLLNIYYLSTSRKFVTKCTFFTLIAIYIAAPRKKVLISLRWNMTCELSSNIIGLKCETRISYC